MKDYGHIRSWAWTQWRPPGINPGCCFGIHLGCGVGRGWQRFFSSAEEMEFLERNLEDLKKEEAGVVARIRELKG
uniref:DUF5320 domain-containing protein n=1 Tax=Desulfobacca acetoxidans TaxID=60893 RepID=A0A7C3WLU3_9BACT